MAKTKSPAVTGVPSDQVASRRWKVQVRPSGLVVQAVAMAGIGRPCALRSVSPTITWLTILPSQVPSILAGSSETGSAALP
jgi:hypothetical protein